MKITIEKCGDFEENNCFECGYPLRSDENDSTKRAVKVDNPRYNKMGMQTYCHLQCWDANHLSVTSLFHSSNIREITSSSFQVVVDERPSLLIGWSNMADRLEVL